MALDGAGTRLSAAPETVPVSAGEVVLGIRSSDVVVSAERGAGDVNQLEGVVKEFTYLGNFIAYQIETHANDRPIIATSGLEFAVADRVWLHLDPAKLMVLERDAA